MTSRQDITSPPSPPSSRVILQPRRYCQRWDPVSHRRTQWPHCTPLTALFSPVFGGTMRSLSTQYWEAGRTAVRCFSSRLVSELNPRGEFVLNVKAITFWKIGPLGHNYQQCEENIDADAAVLHSNTWRKSNPGPWLVFLLRVKLLELHYSVPIVMVWYNSKVVVLEV